MFWIAIWIGALLPTVIVSRLVLLALKRWDAGTTKLIIAYAISWVICVVITSFGAADGGPNNYLRGIINNTPPLALWMVLDFLVYRRTGEVRLVPANFKRKPPST